MHFKVKEIPIRGISYDRLLAQKIVEECPITYAEYKGTGRDYLQFNQIGVGQGWLLPIYKLSKKLEKFNETALEPIRPDQIKEKFGTLRYYLNWTTDEVYDWLIECEEECSVRCEYCGSTKDVQPTGGWVKNLCVDCRAAEAMRKQQWREKQQAKT